MKKTIPELAAFIKANGEFNEPKDISVETIEKCLILLQNHRSKHWFDLVDSVVVGKNFVAFTLGNRTANNRNYAVKFERFLDSKAVLRYKITHCFMLRNKNEFCPEFDEIIPRPALVE